MVDFLSGFSLDMYILDYGSKPLSKNMHVCAHIFQVKPLTHCIIYQNDKRIMILDDNFHNLNEGNMII